MTDNVHRYGFRYHSARHGSHIPDIYPYLVATGYQGTDDSARNVDLRKGDPVSKVADGTVALTAAQAPAYGIIMGIGRYWNGTTMMPTDVLPGGTAWGTNYERASVVWVMHVTEAVWEVDFDSTSQPTTRAGWEALIHANFEHLNVGDTTITAADPFIDVSSAATTESHEWQCVGIQFDNPDNFDLTGANVKGLFVANLSQAAGQAATNVATV